MVNYILLKYFLYVAITSILDISKSNKGGLWKKYRHFQSLRYPLIKYYYQSLHVFNSYILLMY